MDTDLVYFDLLFLCNLSTVIVCIFNKIPQILALYKKQSAVGVSCTGVSIELFGYTIALCYNYIQNYPLSSYVEYFFLVGQDVILILYIFYILGTLDILKFGGVGLFFIIFYGFTLGIPYPGTLHVLIKLGAPIIATSKLIHLKEIWTTRNSESVSVLSWVLALYSCGIRIITTMLTSGDGSLLTNYFTAFLLNIAVIGSALYFKKKDSIVKQD